MSDQDRANIQKAWDWLNAYITNKIKDEMFVADVFVFHTVTSLDEIEALAV